MSPNTKMRKHLFSIVKNGPGFILDGTEPNNPFEQASTAYPLSSETEFWKRFESDVVQRHIDGSIYEFNKTIYSTTQDLEAAVKAHMAIADNNPFKEKLRN